MPVSIGNLRVLFLLGVLGNWCFAEIRDTPGKALNDLRSYFPAPGQEPPPPVVLTETPSNPITAKRREFFAKGTSPTEEHLRLGMVWECNSYSAFWGDTASVNFELRFGANFIEDGVYGIALKFKDESEFTDDVLFSTNSDGDFISGEFAASGEPPECESVKRFVFRAQRKPDFEETLLYGELGFRFNIEKCTSTSKAYAPLSGTLGDEGYFWAATYTRCSPKRTN